MTASETPMPSADELWTELQRLRAEGAYPFLCGKAYNRWFHQACLEGKDPSRLRRDSLDVDERIAARTIEGLDGCLIWDGRMNPYGQPIVSMPKKTPGRDLHVRRYLLRKAGRGGEILPHRRITTTCGNRRCIALAHILVEEHHWRRRYSPEQMLASLKAFAERLGRTPSEQAWERSGNRPVASYFGQMFGSWARALDRAGLPPAEKRNQNSHKTHCDRGHPLAGENLYVYPSGRRSCRTCKRASDRRYWRRQAAKQNGKLL